jgi:tetratricopeptide (TPR) repeat protein
MKRRIRTLHALSLCLLAAWAATLANCAPSVSPPPAAKEGLRLLYSGDADAAMERFRQLQAQAPNDPLGYLLEAEARWWTIYCESVEFKWGVTDAWHRDKQASDEPYLALAGKAIALAQARLGQTDSAEMHLYEGLGYALETRLYSLRDAKRAEARAGVRAREQFLRALDMDPSLADADTGLGLYNYYVDTLSGLAKLLRFFMGLPGGSRKEGVRQLEHAAHEALITSVEARFYLAKNLRNFDRQYEQALKVMQPLAEEYPSNPIFQLFLGDLTAKLGLRDKAEGYYRTAAALPARDPACQERIQKAAAAALASLGK